MGRVILRLVYKVLEGPTLERIPSSLGRFLGDRDAYEVLAYTAKLDSLIIQYPEGADSYRYTGPISIAGEPWRTYCRWHNGPLDRRDSPWERLYCTVEARDYCRYHRRSARSLYELCLSLRGPQALEACKRVDDEISGEYSLYLSYTGKGVKVGVTRSFRLLDRLAEQPHSLATRLAVYDSLYRARRAEIAVARGGIAGETGVRKPRRPDPGAAAPALSYAAERASKLLGVEWEGELFRVKPPDGLLASPLVSPSSSLGILEPVAYWGGLLQLSSRRGLIVLRVKDLLHRDSVVVG